MGEDQPSYPRTSARSLEKKPSAQCWHSGFPVSEDHRRGRRAGLGWSNANGSSLKRITESPTYDFNPSFSPDGKKIAFDRYGGEKGPNSVCRLSCIYTIRVDGTGLKRLTGSKAIAEDPDWSPNGKKIAYASYDGRHDSEIYTINATGGKPVQVTYNYTHDAVPDWGSRP